MNRRTFLGAAAAALSLPGSAAGEEDTRVEVREDSGAGVGNVPRSTTARTALNLFEDVDEESEIGATGYWLDDEPPHVEMTVATDLASLRASMSPEDARALAADLRLAATHAEQGAERMGTE